MSGKQRHSAGVLLLSATRLASFRRCPRQYYLRYELGLARVRKAAPLRFGSAFHCGLELRRSGQSRELAIQAATADYESCPDWAEPQAWAVEREQVRALLAGHFWRYGQDDLEYAAVEQAFDLPLHNPATGARSSVLRVAGRIDALVRLSDGRAAVLESKTAGEDIAPDGEYWLRLRCDGQISLYVLAARALGFDAATVLYDVTRKPTIRLRRGETPEAYGERLLADIGERPGFYFQRREVPRLEDELAAFQAELWQQGRQLLEFRRRARRLADPAHAWYRNVSRVSCRGCEFAELCLNAVHIDPEQPPAGFERLSRDTREHPTANTADPAGEEGN
jgi:hypothetical protein